MLILLQSILIIHNTNILIPMFMNCFSSHTQAQCKHSFNNKSKHYKEVSSRLTSQEISLLSLIYEDLSTRIVENKLTFQNFLNFFNLTGLWGAKLFHQFDQDHLQLITFEEFLYGISQTAKAPFQEKIRLLYSFFSDKVADGIDFKSFTKMLYNYSKDELKQILLRDQLISHEPMSAFPIIKRKPESQRIVEVNIPQSAKIQSKSGFDVAYQSLLQNHNEGTYLEIDTHNLTYKIKYSNMNALIQEFANNVYNQHYIDTKLNPNGKLSYENFSNWIKSHKKLFKSYYSAFHTDIWATQDGQPSYMASNIQFQFTGRIQCGSLKSKIYGFQVEDIIICCESKKTKKKPIKIICLQGLNILDVGNLGIQISHPSQIYRNSIFWFDNEAQHKKWLEHLKIYQRDSVHQNYIIGETIGNGKFSVVYRGIQKANGKVFAIKDLDLSKLNERAIKAISNQSEIMKIINHKQVVKYFDTVKTKTHLYIITQYIYGEDLYEYVTKRDHLNQFQSAFIIGNVIKAVMFLHSLDIIHRDLKPENIMVMFKDKKADQIFECTTPFIRQGQRIQNIKIIDFGLANHISVISKMDKNQKISGTPNYIAPQIILGQETGFQSDAFSVGCVLYFLIRGRLPFASTTAEKTLRRTIKGQYDMTSDFWSKVSDDVKDLIQNLLCVDPHQRITLQQALNHKWFQNVFNKTREASELSQFKENQNNLCRKEKFKLQNIQLQQYQRHRKTSISRNTLNPQNIYQ